MDGADQDALKAVNRVVKWSLKGLLRADFFYFFYYLSKSLVFNYND